MNDSQEPERRKRKDRPDRLEAAQKLHRPEQHTGIPLTRQSATVGPLQAELQIQSGVYSPAPQQMQWSLLGFRHLQLEGSSSQQHRIDS